MTEVRIDVRRPDAVTPEVGVAGRMLRWTPWDRRVEPTWVTPPAQVVVPLVDGVATAVLVPGYWRVDELTPGGVSRVVQVPDVELVEYAALVSLDPESLEPSEAAIPAWEAAVAEVQAGVGEVRAALPLVETVVGAEAAVRQESMAAIAAAEDAETSRVQAAQHRAAAEQALAQIQALIAQIPGGDQ